MIRSICAVLLTFIAAIALGQGAPPTIKIVFPKTAKAGAAVKGTIEVTFADGLHSYQNPPTEDYMIPVKVAVENKGFTLTAKYPKGVMKAMGGDPKPAGVYEGTIKIPVTLKVPKNTGTVQVKFTLHYQECNDQSCFPPADVSDTVKLQITK